MWVFVSPNVVANFSCVKFVTRLFCTCFVHLLKALFFVCSELFYAGKYLFFGEAMDAKVAHRLQFSSLIQNEKINIGRNFCGSVKFSRVFKEPKNVQVCVLQHESVRVCSNRPRGVPLEVSCSYNNFPGCCLFINRILFFDQLFGFFFWMFQLYLLFYYWFPFLLLCINGFSYLRDYLLLIMIESRITWRSHN